MRSGLRCSVISLCATAPDLMGGIVPRKWIALRRLDTNDARTELAEKLAHERRSHADAQIDHDQITQHFDVSRHWLPYRCEVRGHAVSLRMLDNHRALVKR